MDDLEALIGRLKEKAAAGDRELLDKLLHSYVYLQECVADERTTIADLRHLLGMSRSTEKTRDIRAGTEEDGPSRGGASDDGDDGDDADDADDGDGGDDGDDGDGGGPAGGDDEEQKKRKKKKRKGHGRLGADAYRGAKKVTVAHATLHPGDPCPNAQCTGRIYTQKPGVIIRVTGQAPIMATRYDLEKLRCNLCGEVFTADPPEGVGDRKYDDRSAAMIALLKYGSGMPFNRLAGLQRALHIPLPAATQWKIVEETAAKLKSVHDALIREAAQGEVLYNDDTHVKILELMGKRRADALREAEASDGISADRTGLFTSGIVSTREDRKIALFFSGRKHAGENLGDVLRKRAADLDAPIQMCDALSRNYPDDLRVILANCISHCRRNFVDVASVFPEECLHVLDLLSEVYKNDAVTKERKLSPEERLAYHKQHSASVMAELRDWLDAQFEERRVEPNSSLGAAIQYARNHWEKLTLFLRKPGAPLDNNICERVLKKAILHRKNALFYRSERGAAVGDLFMSLLYTCEFENINPLDYLITLLAHADRLDDQPDRWLPWNYGEQLPRA